MWKYSLSICKSEHNFFEIIQDSWFIDGKTSSSIESDDELRRKISDSVWDLQHIVKRISREKNKIAADMILIIHTSKKLAIWAEILEYENKELYTIQKSVFTK